MAVFYGLYESEAQTAVCYKSGGFYRLNYTKYKFYIIRRTEKTYSIGYIVYFAFVNWYYFKYLKISCYFEIAIFIMLFHKNTIFLFDYDMYTIFDDLF